MRKPRLITAPFVTPLETAETLGVPRRQALELIKRVSESLEEQGYEVTSLNAHAPAPKAPRLSAKLRAASRPKSRPKSRTASRRKLSRAPAKRSQ